MRQVDIKWNSVFTFEPVQDIWVRITPGSDQGSGEPVPYSHTQSMHVDEVSAQNLDILPHWIFQHDGLN